jgi:hypothetical protein
MEGVLLTIRGTTALYSTVMAANARNRTSPVLTGHASREFAHIYTYNPQGMPHRPRARR